MDSPELSARPRIRLQRFLAACGLGSRRACEQFITEGRVSIDGQTVEELGATVDPSSQKVALDGERLKMERKRYYVLHKPPGFLCTNSDPAGRRRAIDLLPSDGPRLFTVGRLDEHSTGLLVVTNDGDLAEKLAHPRNQIYRTYHIQVAGHPTREVYEQLKEGLRFAEGRFRVRSVKVFKKVGQSSWLEVVLSEGHNRELRRLFARVGHKVLKLTRISFGSIRLGKLKMGEYRDLSLSELESLHGLLARSKAPKKYPDRYKGKPDDQRTSSEKPMWDEGGDAKSGGERTSSSSSGRRPGFAPNRGQRPGTPRPDGKRAGSPRPAGKRAGTPRPAGKRPGSPRPSGKKRPNRGR